MVQERLESGVRREVEKLLPRNDLADPHAHVTSWKDFCSSSTPRHRSTILLPPIMSGVKRTSPGAEEQKNPLALTLSDDDGLKLENAQKAIARVELKIRQSLVFNKYPYS